MLQLHAPHLGATALPVEVEEGASIPGGSSAVTATASRGGSGLAVTVINRHHSAAASVRLKGAAGRAAGGQLLAAALPQAANSLAQPALVAPASLPVGSDGHNSWCVELPAHSVATILFS
jgi:hypothetical protein